MRKASLLFVVIAVLLILAAAPAAAQNKVTLVLGTEPGFHLDPLVANADRCASEAGVSYSFSVFPGGEWTTSILPPESATKSGLFDIVNIPTSTIAQFVAADYLAPLEQFDLKAVNSDDLTFFQMSEYKGQHYLVPFINEFQGLIYRTDLLADPKEQDAFKAKYGYALAVPRTLKQYMDQVEFFNRPDQKLFGSIQYGLRAIWITIAYEELMNMHGVEPVHHSTLAIGVNSPEGVAALQDLAKIYKFADPASLTSGWVEGNANFNEGRDYSILTWNSVLLYINDPTANAKVAGKVAFQLIPFPDDKLQNPAGYVSQWGPAITKTSKHPQEAFKFVTCLTNTQSGVNAVVGTSLGMTPARISVLQDAKAAARFPWFASVAEGVKRLNIIDRPSIPEYYSNILAEVLPENLSKMITGQLTPEQTAAALEKQITDIMKKGGYIH